MGRIQKIMKCAQKSCRWQNVTLFMAKKKKKKIIGDKNNWNDLWRRCTYNSVSNGVKLKFTLTRRSVCVFPALHQHFDIPAWLPRVILCRVTVSSPAVYCPRSSRSAPSKLWHFFDYWLIACVLTFLLWLKCDWFLPRVLHLGSTPRAVRGRSSKLSFFKI